MSKQVWREVHYSPVRGGARSFECRSCHAVKSTKRNHPKVCEFCGAGRDEVRE